MTTKFFPRLLRVFLVLAATSLVGTSAQGAILVNYNFNNANPTSTATNLFAANATWTGIFAANGFTGTAFAFSGGVPSSFSADSYLQFSLTANSGFRFNLTDMEFSLGGTSTGSYTVNANVRSSADSYGSNITMSPGDVTTAIYSIPSGTSYTNFTVNLGNVASGGLTAITLRIYPTDSANDGSLIYRLNHMTLNGDVVAVPEPNVVSLLAVALIGILVLRRSFSQSRWVLK